MTRVALAIILLAACGSAPPPPPTTPPPPPAVISNAPRAIIERALVAKGGRDRLAAVAAFRFAAQGTDHEGATIENVRTFAVPDRQRSRLARSTKDGARMVVTNLVLGARAWRMIESGATSVPALAPLPPADAAVLALDTWRDLDLLLLKASAPDARIAAEADEVIDGKPCHVVTVAGPDGAPVTLAIDKATSLVARLRYADNGALRHHELSDYRAVDGIQFAFHRKIVFPGGWFDITYVAIEVDPEIAPAELVAPSE